jgi:hypothetical protein
VSRVASLMLAGVAHDPAARRIVAAANADLPVRVEIVAEIEREPGPAATLTLVRSEI